jgi:regulator of sirC expression with transglutaminase-like and TPR domain
MLLIEQTLVRGLGDIFLISKHFHSRSRSSTHNAKFVIGTMSAALAQLAAPHSHLLVALHRIALQNSDTKNFQYFKTFQHLKCHPFEGPALAHPASAAERPSEPPTFDLTVLALLAAAVLTIASTRRAELRFRDLAQRSCCRKVEEVQATNDASLWDGMMVLAQWLDPSVVPHALEDQINEISVRVWRELGLVDLDPDLDCPQTPSGFWANGGSGQAVFTPDMSPNKPSLEPSHYRDFLVRQGVSEVNNTKLKAAAVGTRRFLTAVGQVFTNELGFQGAPGARYYKESNSMLHMVLTSREGIPISLSAIFSKVCESAGNLRLGSVNMPGHFILSAANGEPLEERIFIDVFAGVRLMSADEAMELVTRRGMAAQPEFLTCTTAPRVWQRCLRNLNIVYEEGSGGDLQKQHGVLTQLVALGEEIMAKQGSSMLQEEGNGEEDSASTARECAQSRQSRFVFSLHRQTGNVLEDAMADFKGVEAFFSTARDWNVASKEQVVSANRALLKASISQAEEELADLAAFVGGELECRPSVEANGPSAADADSTTDLVSRQSNVVSLSRKLLFRWT